MTKLTRVKVVVNDDFKVGSYFEQGELKEVYYLNNKPYIVDSTGDRLFFDLEESTYGWFSESNDRDFNFKEGNYTIMEVEDLSLKHLREKALQALDDGLLDRVAIKRTITPRVLTFDNDGAMRVFNDQQISEGLQYIESLYTASFEVTKEEDLKRIKKGAEGILANGNHFTVTDTAAEAFGAGSPLALIVNCKGLEHNELVYISTLKGATITQ